MEADGREVTVTTASLADLKAENARLRAALAKSERRARLAEEQLLRVHRAVQAVKKESRRVRHQGSSIIEGARVQATELVRQAEREARARRAGRNLDGRPLDGWNDVDPALDEKLESYLRHELEPDPSRDWILGDRSV